MANEFTEGYRFMVQFSFIVSWIALVFIIWVVVKGIFIFGGK